MVCRLISIIVPTFNSGRTLGFLFESLRKQSFRNFEVIVVDRSSGDETIEIAGLYAARILTFGGHLSEARNLGASASNGDFLLFLDSDHEIEVEALAELAELADAGYKMADLPETVIGEGFFGKIRSFEAECYLRSNRVNSVRFVEKALFFRLGGFRITDAEDWDLRDRAIKLGYSLGLVKAKKLHHEEFVTFYSRLKKKFRYSKAISNYTKSLSFLEQLKLLPILRHEIYGGWRKTSLHIFLCTLILKALETLAFACGHLYHSSRRFLRGE